MRIVGIDNMTVAELLDEVNRGARFKIFQYNISLLIVSFKRPTDIHFVRAGQGSFGKAVGPTFLSLLLGPWGIPFGIIFTIETLIVNLKGGRDVTREVLDSILASSGESHAPADPPKPWARGRNG